MHRAKRCYWKYSGDRQGGGILAVWLILAQLLVLPLLEVSRLCGCHALSMPSSAVKSTKHSMFWLDQASMVWDPDMINENNCYWNEQWLSILRNDGSKPKNEEADHPDTDDNKTNESKNNDGTHYGSHSICYQTLFTMAALMVVELREKLKIVFENKSDKNNDKIDGMSVVVAIPEGPLLPLATLVVHALNQPQEMVLADGRNARCFAILVPLEPSEAKKRNLHILKDISPSLILTVPGKDSENLQTMVDSLSTVDPEFVDLSLLLKSIVRNADLAREVTRRTLKEDTSSWGAAWPIGSLIATLANEVSRALDGAPIPENTQSAMNEPRVSHIVYTSGTTGVPKGCISSIASLEHYLKSKNEVHGIDESCTVLLASALSFDPCLSDCLATFQAGATLALAPRSALLSSLPNILQQLEVTHVLCTPTLWSLMSMHRPADVPRLQLVALGGEPIPVQLQRTWGRKEADVAQSCRLFATYGVTEACVYQTCGEVSASSSTKIKGQFVGQPFEGTGVRICKEDDQDKMVGVEPGNTGEIVLHGAQLDGISGYLNRPDLKKFQMDSNGTQHYRTGDRGTLNAATNRLYISGRIVGEEGMVKVNGVRVELGEIENALVDQVVVGCQEEHTPVVLSCMAKVVSVSTGANDESLERNEIQAFCVLSEQIRNELNLDQNDPSFGRIVNDGPILTLLRSRCMENLKAACIPKAFVIIPRLPLSPTGKRSRDGLPELDSCRPLQSADKEPVLLKEHGKCGKMVSEILIESLNLQPSQENMLTTSATFGMLGGDSLAATRVTRALYAYHHQVENNRFLGGAYGKLTGAFDVVRLLRSEDLGAYVELLDRQNLCQPKNGNEPSSNSDEPQELDDDNDDRTEGSKPEDAENMKQNVLYNSLIQAITLGQSSIAIGLLSTGADPNYNLHSGRLGKVTHRLQQRALFRSSPLHIACMRGDDRVVRKLLEKGSKTNSPDASGMFPIHLASSAVKLNDNMSASEDSQKRLVCVQHLLKAGAPVTIRDGNKQSILHCAARAGHCELLRFVMARWKGKNGDKITPQHFFNWNDRWFRTAVHWAVLNGQVKALEVLLEMGCNSRPFKPKTNNRSSAAVESPMEMCQRLYDKDDGGVGTKIYNLLSGQKEL